MEVEELTATPQTSNGTLPKSDAEKYYDYLKSNGADVPPTFQSFNTTLQDQAAAQKYYQYLRDNGFDTPDTYESFANTLGIKKKERATSQNGVPSSKIVQPPSETVTTPISETKEEVPKEPVSPLEMFMGAGASEEKEPTLVEGFVEKYKPLAGAVTKGEPKITAQTISDKYSDVLGSEEVDIASLQEADARIAEMGAAVERGDIKAIDTFYAEAKRKLESQKTPLSTSRTRTSSEIVSDKAALKKNAAIDKRLAELDATQQQLILEHADKIVSLDQKEVSEENVIADGLEMIKHYRPNDYEFYARRLNDGQLNEFDRYKIEATSLDANFYKIKGLLDTQQKIANDKITGYNADAKLLEEQFKAAQQQKNVPEQERIIRESQNLQNRIGADNDILYYNALVERANELVDYSSTLAEKYPQVTKQQEEIAKVKEDYEQGNVATKAYYQTIYPALGGLLKLSKGVMGAYDQVANLTGLMSDDELRDFTTFKQGTIDLPQPPQTQLWNPANGDFQAAGILPTMLDISLQSYGFYKGGALLNKTGVPMPFAQWSSVFVQTLPMFYQQGIDAGFKSDEAQAYAALSAATEASIERILPEEKIFQQNLPNATKAFKNVKNLDMSLPQKMAEFSKGYVKIALPEVTEEVLADYAQNQYQSAANDLSAGKFQVQPFNLEEEAKTALTTAIGMAPMSLVGGGR